MPAYGLGKTERPFATGGLGFFRLKSSLTPVFYLSDEPALHLSTVREDGLVTEESLIYVKTEHKVLVISEEGVDELVSQEPVRNLVSEEPDPIQFTRFANGFDKGFK